MTSRRIAFFTDSYHEVNGVALTSREFIAFARRKAIPVLSVHAGPSDATFQDGSTTTVHFQRGRLRWNLEHDLAFDWLFLKHKQRLRAAMEAFRPDLVHITGPNDAGILGAMLAYEFRVPLVASWHTNLHEFAARRLDNFLSWLPAAPRSRIVHRVEKEVLAQCTRFYRLAKIVLAPNPELVEMLERRTGRRAFLMRRGIDTNLFSPLRRDRWNEELVVGYVGRLSPEKNVRMFAQIEKALIEAGCKDYRFLIVGEGSERPWLRSTLQRATLPGILRGEELARAYASMDVFVFPSSTDTFGNVVLEAMASGVPALVTSWGGPKYLVKPGENGAVAGTAAEFAAAILKFRGDPGLLSHTRANARSAAERYSWDAVFEEVHRAYEFCFCRTSVNVKSRASIVQSRALARSASQNQ